MHAYNGVLTFLVRPKAIACEADLSFNPDVFLNFFSPDARSPNAWADQREILHDGQY